MVQWGDCSVKPVISRKISFEPRLVVPILVATRNSLRFAGRGWLIPYA